jgi:hypothetical protein
MREPTDSRAASGRSATEPVDTRPGSGNSVTEGVRAARSGLVPLLAEAKATWLARAEAAGSADESSAVGGTGGPSWSPFEDAFPTFYQFTNRPR